jgi:mannose-6-phosphate isomerase-like protein (cupin superfamily)
MLPNRSTLVLLVAALLITTLRANAEPRVAFDENEDARVCTEGVGRLPQAEGADAWLTDRLPSGVEAVLLASKVAEELPEPPATLKLTRVLLEPTFGSTTRPAVGPVLFYLVSGQATIAVEGEEMRMRPGDSVLAQLGDDYAVVNHGREVATLLRLAVVPPDSSDQAVINSQRPDELLTTPPAGPAVSHLLVQDMVDPLPIGEGRLFIACLRVPQTGADLGTHLLPGPVGLRVEVGRLDLDDSILLGETGCAVFQAETVHRLDAEDPPPAALLFGAIPGDQNLWGETEQAAAASEPSSSLDCGED